MNCLLVFLIQINDSAKRKKKSMCWFVVNAVAMHYRNTVCNHYFLLLLLLKFFNLVFNLFDKDLRSIKFLFSAEKNAWRRPNGNGLALVFSGWSTGNSLTIARRCFFYSFDQTLFGHRGARAYFQQPHSLTNENAKTKNTNICTKNRFSNSWFSNLCLLLFVDTT